MLFCFERYQSSINPSNTRYYAQAFLPQENFGKIRSGQKVQLRFDAYPYEEYGSLDGRLVYISSVPADSGYLANIQLPSELITDIKNRIQYRSGLKAKALIITKNARLLQRLYWSITKSIQH